MPEKIIIQQLKEENKRLNENDNYNENENEIETFEKNKIVKNSNIKVLIEKPKQIKSPNWLDKKKFKEILTIIDGNKFGHKNKIGNFKYIDVKVLVNEDEDKDYKNKNENDETLMSSDKDDDYDYDYENKDENKDETMD